MRHTALRARQSPPIELALYLRIPSTADGRRVLAPLQRLPGPALDFLRELLQRPSQTCLAPAGGELLPAQSDEERDDPASKRQQPLQPMPREVQQKREVRGHAGD